MGCDIHMVLECYDEDAGIWVGLHGYYYPCPQALDMSMPNYEPLLHPVGHVGYKATQRNYELFGAIAGVRGESVFGREPKGLPDDASTLTELLVREYGDDGHSHSYLTVEEFVEALAYVRGKTADLVAERLHGTPSRKTFQELTMEVTGITIGCEDLRIVFWFDN